MRVLVTTTLWATFLTLVWVQAQAQVVSADRIVTPKGGATLVVNLQIDGTYYDDAGARRRLCDPEFTFFSTTDAPTIELPNEPSAYTRTIDGVEQTLYWTMCIRIPPSPPENPEQAMTPQVRDQQTAWVGRPTPGAVVETIFGQLQLIIDPPIVSWPTIDPEFGWLYVNTNMEFRVAALTPKAVTGTLTNIVGTATATLSATPVAVTFSSGEPGGGSTTCSVDDASAPFYVDIIGACAYKYRAASSVAANGRTFDTRMVVHWDVTGDLEPDTPRTLETYTDAPVAVAEVQALVCSNVGC